jgi:hypothetical protein
MHKQNGDFGGCRGHVGDSNQGVRRVVPMSIDQADGQLSNHDWFEFARGAWVDESEMWSGLW